MAQCSMAQHSMTQHNMAPKTQGTKGLISLISHSTHSDSTSKDRTSFHCHTLEKEKGVSQWNLSVQTCAKMQQIREEKGVS